MYKAFNKKNKLKIFGPHLDITILKSLRKLNYNRKHKLHLIYFVFHTQLTFTCDFVSQNVRYLQLKLLLYSVIIIICHHLSSFRIIIGNLIAPERYGLL